MNEQDRARLRAEMKALHIDFDDERFERMVKVVESLREEAPEQQRLAREGMAAAPAIED